jgi:RimJ/RimL family protein N-acetyltransferase
MTIDIQVLETERLILRGWREDDLDAYAAMMADPEVTRFIGGVQTRNDCWRSIAAIIGHWVLRGHGMWAVERKNDNALIGRIGVWRPEGWPATEVVWTLGRPYWRQGYATEAARASLDWGFRTLPVPQLISLINAENFASQNVAKRLGYTKAGQATISVYGMSFTGDVWKMPRTCWSPQK